MTSNFIIMCIIIFQGIIRVKGWNRAASKDDDDYSRVMIITEGIGVIISCYFTPSYGVSHTKILFCYLCN